MQTSSYESLSHSKWDCKYHIVFIPKGRKKVLYGQIRKFLGPVFREFAGQLADSAEVDARHVISIRKRLAGVGWRPNVGAVWPGNQPEPAHYREAFQQPGGPVLLARVEYGVGELYG